MPSRPEPSAAAATGSTRSSVLVLALAAFFSGAALRICDGLLPRLAADFGITAGTAGQVVLTFAIAYGVSQLVFGPLGDRYGKALVVCCALFGCAGAALACAFAGGFDMLLRLRVLWGIAAGGVIPLAIAWIGDAVPYEERQATLARLLLGTLSGMSAGQLGGGLFADSPLGWRGAFGALCAGYVVIAVMLLARLRSMPSAPPAQGGRLAFFPQLAAVAAIPWARLVVGAALLEGVFLIGALAFLPSYLHQRFGIPLSAAGALVALYAVGGLLYAMAAKPIVRRLGERRMVLHGGWIVGAGFAAWAVAPAAWWAGPIALVVGFGTYMFHNTLQTHATQMAPAMRGSGMALFAFCLFLGQAIGVWMAGASFDRFGALPLLLLPAVALPLTGWGFSAALRRRAGAAAA
ncbi:MFS transporter [Ramlibacter pallidus]|uniref:MFS transporter n=1 Tax=Ramlibacter pallidus TaxID=2780087 RepID=UPI00338D5359